MIHSQNNTIIAEYVWLDGFMGLRSKARTLSINYEANLLEQLPEWNYDGSSTNQAPGNDSEVIMKPRSYFKCPFRKENNILVLCDTYTPYDIPLLTNNRHMANDIFNKNLDQEPWFGIEQEFFMINPETNLPLGFPHNGYPAEQGPYYCGVGAGNLFGRKLIDELYEALLYTGIKVSGINAEVACGQWEYQIGPCTGIESGDHLWMSRYILERLGEKHNIKIDWEPKPIKGDWNGSGCHTNYSTKDMRNGTEDKEGIRHINEAIEKLAKKHNQHIKAYGSGNEERLTGKHETASIDEFSYGVANRGASIRIPRQTEKDKKGYMEDRRPASNMDPYLVTSMIFNTTVIE